MNEEIEVDLSLCSVGKFLLNLRKLNKMTQEELADKCKTSKSYISRLESTNKDIRLSTLTQLLEKGFNAKIVIKFKV